MNSTAHSLFLKKVTRVKPTIHMASETQEMVTMRNLSKRLHTRQALHQRWRGPRRHRVQWPPKRLPRQQFPKQRLNLSSGGARNISVHGANQFRAQHCGDRLNSQPSQCLTLQWIRMPQLSVFSLMVVATKPPISPWCPGWFLRVSSSNFVIRKVLEIQNNFSNISNSNTRQWFQTLTRLTETTQ